MYILAIDTTGPLGTVALAEAGEASKAAKAVQENAAGQRKEMPMRVTTTNMSHLKNLMAMIKELLDEESIEKNDIAAVAASAGPGSFTGIRIGVSTARALAQAWGVPCISVPTLEEFIFRGNDNGDQDSPVCVILNARRGQVYAACFGKDGKALIEPGPYMLADILDRIEEFGISPVFYGDGIDSYADTDEFRERLGKYTMAPESVRYQTARMTAGLALGKLSRGETLDYSGLLPDYMRESEAEQRLKDGSLERMRKEKLERFMKANS